MAVRIDRVVTRGGDAGETSLGDGARVRKDDDRIVALGSVDEANAA
ncbi:MAG: ATP:cob(I)alamin adenosyltransferase, partial [Acetobacteraceae bacterium]|nr:ATP:cob(I)alamin adenosyltransferase [Acetobacteraceae bacterium]